MTQAQTTITTQTSTNGSGKAKAKQPAIEAIKKISTILDQLTPQDRRRVLAFVNETENSGSGE